MHFRELLLEDKKIFDPYRNICSDYVFSYLYMYRNLYKLSIAIEDDSVIIRSEKGSTHFYMPLGNTEKGIKAVLAYCKETGIAPVFTKIPEQYRYLFHPWNLEVVEDRDSFDYIYRNSDFLEYIGKDFRKQRNNFFSYLKTYTPRFDDSIEQYIEACKQFTFKHHNTPDILEPTITMLDHIELFHLKGGVVINEGEIAAFCLYEEVAPNMIQSHVELTDNSHRGVHPYLINELAKRIGDKYINKEDDMGLPGLRKFKETFNPCSLLKKYKAY